MTEKRNESGWLLRHPAVMGAIGVSATTVLALLVVIFLLRTGGAKAVSDNAALIGALVALGGVFTTQMVSIALDDRRTQESRNIEDRRTQETRALEDRRIQESRELEAQRAHETALQNYFEQVGTLLIEQPLRRASPGDNLSTVVRAQTLSVLEGLDPDRKRILLQFLYESGLIDKDKPVLSLISANLSGAHLREAILSGADLSGADLRDAILINANLSGATLINAILLKAHLYRAILSGATLINAHLSEAILINAILLKAYLDEANLIGAYLSNANLSSAILSRTMLSGAYLDEANLSGAYLSEAILSGADLRGANLSGANLNEAKGLTQTQIDWTIGDEATKLPESFVRPPAWSKGANEQDEIIQERLKQDPGEE